MLLVDLPEVLGTEAKDRLDEIRSAAPGFQVRYLEDAAGIESEIKDAEIVVGLKLGPTALARAKALRWFHSWGAGVSGMLYPELVASPVVVTCSKGNGGVPLAEHAIMLMLMLSREAPYHLRSQSEKRWDTRFHGELNNMTVGIIGLGHCGADLAQKCKAFHMRVVGLRRSMKPCANVDELFTRERLHDLLAQSDFVVVTAPLTEETRGMLGEDELRIMKPSSYIVVVSRGAIVQEEPLLRALNEGWVGGAGLDAHSAEPLPPDSPFWAAKNTIITPHCGALSNGMRVRTLDIFIDNLRRYVRGEPLRNIVDKRVGY